MTRFTRRSRIKSETSRKRDSRICKKQNRSMPSTNNTRLKRGSEKYSEKKIQLAHIYHTMLIYTAATFPMTMKRAKSMRRSLLE